MPVGERRDTSWIDWTLTDEARRKLTRSKITVTIQQPDSSINSFLYFFQVHNLKNILAIYRRHIDLTRNPLCLVKSYYPIVLSFPAIIIPTFFTPDWPLSHLSSKVTLTKRLTPFLSIKSDHKKKRMTACGIGGMMHPSRGIIKHITHQHHSYHP